MDGKMLRWDQVELIVLVPTLCEHQIPERCPIFEGDWFTIEDGIPRAIQSG
jgi:hypothetical protein